MKAAAVLVLALLASAASAEQVYKWTDRNGVVHFSNAPPSAEEQEGAKAPLVATDVYVPPPREPVDPDALRRQVEILQGMNDRARAERAERAAAAAAIVAEQARRTQRRHRPSSNADDSGVVFGTSGDIYSRGAGGVLFNTRNGAYLTPAGPGMYFDITNGRYVPAN